MKVSVIMAVYNAQSTMERMIQSLQGQTLDDFEIIIVDDGSTDGSSTICDEYAVRDKRIKVIHQANGGVSAARQVGMNTACGEYVIHADADDYVEPMMLEKLYAKAKEDNADVVFCDFYTERIDGSVIRIKQEPPATTSETLKAMLCRLMGSCWNKLVRRSCFSKYDIHFPYGLDYCEDLLTWVQLFKHPEVRITYLDAAYYHYVANPSSLTRQGNMKMLERIRLFTKRMAEVLPKGDVDIDNYISTLPIAPFQYGFQHKLISDDEARTEYKRLRRIIWKDAKSRRRKLGYVFIELNMMSIARKLISI